MTYGWERRPDDVDQQWKRYGYKLQDIERDIDRLRYESVFNPAAEPIESEFTIGLHAPRNDNGVSLAQVHSIVSAASLGPPHGMALLQPAKLPRFPEIPPVPAKLPGWVTKGNDLASQAARAAEKLDRKSARFVAIFQSDMEMLNALSKGYPTGEPIYVELLANLALGRHHLPKALWRPADIHFDQQSRTILCELELPSFASIKFIKQPQSKSFEHVAATATERKKACETILYACGIRAAYLIAMSDVDNHFDAVAVNLRQERSDIATGAAGKGVVASLHALKDELQALRPGHFDARECFDRLKGVATPSIDRVAEVRPFFVHTRDGRVVPNRDAAPGLDAAENPAALPWDEFERLVRRLLACEFGGDGVEVRIARASPDHGVDAIVYDPDPFRGGRFVLQARRHAHAVDAAAVRDLYGTVVSEGANRGILVTVSSFDPDAYAFARDKPISLVDGPDLVAMLRRHGRAGRTDLAEARSIDAEAADAEA
jgi:restriction system protein